MREGRLDGCGEVRAKRTEARVAGLVGGEEGAGGGRAGGRRAV